MFEKLYIYNYFPTDIGEAETRTKQISTLKMAMIHAIMGEDTKALTDEEELNAFFKERYQAERAKSEERSWETQDRNLLNQVKGTEIHEIALQIPHRARIAREVEKPCNGVVLFGKKGNDFIFKIGNNTEDAEEGGANKVHTKGHASVFDEIDLKPIGHLDAFVQVHVGLDRHLNDLVYHKDGKHYTHSNKCTAIAMTFFILHIY